MLMCYYTRKSSSDVVCFFQDSKTRLNLYFGYFYWKICFKVLFVFHPMRHLKVLAIHLGRSLYRYPHRQGASGLSSQGPDGSWYSVQAKDGASWNCHGRGKKNTTDVIK